MTRARFPWLNPDGASQAVLSQLQTEAGPLPSSYIDLLRVGNGGEANLAANPLTLCLDTAEAALDYWRSGSYPIPGVFVFGGDGGGELLAFDTKCQGKWPVIRFDPVDPEGSTRLVAPDFEGLLALIKAHDA